MYQNICEQLCLCLCFYFNMHCDHAKKNVYPVMMILKLNVQGPVMENNGKKHKKPPHGVQQTLDLEIL